MLWCSKNEQGEKDIRRVHRRTCEWRRRGPLWFGVAWESGLPCSSRTPRLLTGLETTRPYWIQRRHLRSGGIYNLHPTQSGESRLLGSTHSYIHPVALTWPPMKSEVVRRRCPTVSLHFLPSLDIPLLSFPLV